MPTITIAHHPNSLLPSSDPYNSMIVGSDALLYVRQLAFVVVKSTPPTAGDYGQPEIPLGAVWIKSPPYVL